MLLSKGKSPISKMITRGNMNTLWYQHKAQGGNSIISLKNRLPSAETQATIQHIKMIVQSELNALSLLVVNIIFLKCPRLYAMQQAAMCACQLRYLITPPWKIAISGAGKIFLYFEIWWGYVDAYPGGIINYYRKSIAQRLINTESILS